MEIKKSRKADLERGRTKRFLTGLAIAAALFLAALEFPVYDNADELSEEDVEDIMEELDMAMQEEEEEEDKTLTTLPLQKQEATDKLKVVEETKEEQPAAPEEARTEQSPGLAPVETTQEDTPADNLQEETVDFRVVQDLPQFPGGIAALMKWLTDNLTYPTLAQERKIQGKVVAQFIVNTDGSVSDLKITKSLDPLCDREALRVLKTMPKWKAGIHNDKPCRTMVAIPIVFNL